MSNQAETDFEKQFQDDLAKATALSLEQQALDDYRRAKKYGNAAYYERSQSTQSETAAASSYYAQLRNRQQRGRSIESTTPAPSTQHAIAAPPSQSQRRYSEVSNAAPSTIASSSAGRERSKTPPPSLLESDLISFSSPTSKQPESSTFEKLIEDLQKMQATNPQTALVPLGPTAAAAPLHLHHNQHPVYRSAPPTAMYVSAAQAQMPQFPNVHGAAAGMQLVPFTPPPQQQKVPLTGEELQKLYNLSHPQQQQQQQHPHMTAYPPQHMGFIAPATNAAVYSMPNPQYTQSAPPTAAVSAAYMPPQYPPRYGFHYNTIPSAAATAASSSPASTYYPGNTTPSVSATSSSSDLSNSHHALAVQIPKSHSTSAVGGTNGSVAVATTGVNNASGIAHSASILRRQTPPMRRLRTGGVDLIDLSQEDDSRVSVLEAFDPLLNEDNGVSKK